MYLCVPHKNFCLTGGFISSIILSMKKIWIKKFPSFREADRFDRNYYRSMSAMERLENMQFLREIYYKLRSSFKNEGRERLRRVIRVIPQK